MINLGLYAYYTINKDMITQKLCVNKSKPQLHCNGKCYLSKQLKKAAENEKKQSQSLLEKDEIISTHPEEIDFTHISSYALVGLPVPYLMHPTSSFLLSLDRPPCHLS
jgi:hypothetical protein